VEPPARGADSFRFSPDERLDQPRTNAVEAELERRGAAVEGENVQQGRAQQWKEEDMVPRGRLDPFILSSPRRGVRALEHSFGLVYER